MWLRLAAVGAFLVAARQAWALWTLGGQPSPLAQDWMWRGFLNGLLFLLFASHHSLWPRARVKARMVAALGAARERPAYVVVASALLWTLCAGWQPLGGRCYELSGGWAGLARGVQFSALLVTVAALRSTDGLALIGWHATPRTASMSESGPYRYVRHPLYAGTLLALLASPTMTPDRAWLSGLMGLYVLLAIPLEERSLLGTLGEPYSAYRTRVRARLVPGLY